MKKIVITTTVIVVLIIFLALVFRFWFGSDGSSPTMSKNNLKLSHAYSLVMRQEADREFSYGKSRRYWLRNKGREITLICEESGGLLGKSLRGSITFDPYTLRGTWIVTRGDVSQGGAIHLNTNPHGFEFKLFNEFGPFTGSPPAYGQLVALP